MFLSIKFVRILCVDYDRVLLQILHSYMIYLFEKPWLFKRGVRGNERQHMGFNICGSEQHAL